MNASKPRQSPGDRIAGRFRVDALLGEGGTSVVYRVTDERNGRQLALKQLRALVGADATANALLFEREYHALCQLAHPRIIAVFDYGVDSAGAYYTMELLDGLDLQSSGRQPFATACALLCDVASSLAIIHSRRLVHRDPSARNVRRTSDGRAKLMDFGALAPMGVAKRVVGTPPYVAPEALERQALDGRADLYALGALAYYLLTGYHAYHARSFGQLRDLWRTAPLPPSQYQPEIPPALDDLVLALLRVERSARPNTAAEVMERLSSIAELPLLELPEVTRSYLLMPNLIGRDEPLSQLREQLERTQQAGRGGCFALEGVPGVGRSRMLEASLLEAKLLGMLVARGDASDAAAGDYGLIRALCAQLWQDAPELCQQAALGREALVAHVLPVLSPEPAPEPARNKLQSAVRDFLLAVARKKTLVIGVDDVEAADESSLALLGLLAHLARQRPVVLIVTCTGDKRARPAMWLIRDLSVPIRLQPLLPEQTETLVRSMFGDVDHTTELAGRIHALGGGNPQWTMTLCAHLVERGAARYEAGSWVLSPTVQAADLPLSIQAALTARVQALPADARELAEALALTEPASLPVDRYPLLSEYDDLGRSYRALDELVARGVLSAAGDRFVFTPSELAQALRAQLAPERAPELHIRIAHALAACDPMLRVYHMLLGGLEREAIGLLLPLLGKPSNSFARFSRRVLDVLERAIAAAARLSLTPREQVALQGHLLAYASLRGDYATFVRYGPPLAARLLRDSGLDGLHALPSPARPSDVAQLIADKARAQAALPESERGLDPARAALVLVRLYPAFGSMAALAKAPHLLDPLPATPVLPAAQPMRPLLQILHEALQSSRALLAGRIIEARARARAHLEMFSHYDLRELEPTYCEQLVLGAHYTVGLYDAMVGNPDTAAVLLELQQHVGIRSNAARVRMIYELMHGNSEAASALRRRAELLSVQDGELHVYPGSTARVELLAFAFADNLLGVKRTLQRIEAIAAEYPGWHSTLIIGKAHYQRLKGDTAGALEVLSPALRSTPFGSDLDWAWAGGTQVALLTALGRHDEAFTFAAHYLELNANHGFAFSHPALDFALGEAFANAGHGERARELMESFIATYARLGARGLLLGIAYETAARIAVRMNDQAAFRRYAGLCDQEYKGGRDLMLQAKYARLMQEAVAKGWPPMPQARMSLPRPRGHASFATEAEHKGG